MKGNRILRRVHGVSASVGRTALVATLLLVPARVLAKNLPTADVIYAGGDIVTINDAQSTAEAVAVKDGKIVAVGAKAAVEKAHRDTTTNLIDLGGKTLMPGFLDAHSHYISVL